MLVCNETKKQKSKQYHGFEYLGVNYDGKMFSTKEAFKMFGLKKPIPKFFRALAETSVEGEFWV